MLKDGLYEQVINNKLDTELAECADKLSTTASIDKAEASKVLSKYLTEVVEKGLDNIIDNGGDISSQVDLVNKIVSVIKDETRESDFSEMSVAERAEQLLSLFDKKNSLLALNENANVVRPESSIAQSSLFTGAIHEPQMYTELKKEIVSCNRIDMLVSFIKWSGLRLIMDELTTFTKNGGELFVAHREEILAQSIYTFIAVLKDANFGEMFVGKYKPDSIDNLFISIQTFNSQDFTEKTTADFYDYIIVDEFHHAAAPTYQKLLEYYNPKILLGLTATPERMDGKSILSYFNNHIAAEIRLPEAIDRKLLCPFQYFGVTDTVDLDSLKWTVDGYDKGELSRIYTFSGMAANRRADLIINSLLKYVTDIDAVKGLGFCVSIEHAEFMNRYFNEHGIPLMYLTGASPDEERKSAKENLVSGKVRFIFVVDIYNEGVDIPEVNTVLFLRPTESLTVFLQQLGRGLRLSEEKECLTVLDFIGQANKKYNFEDKFAALLSNTTRSVAREIKDGFVSVPKGCYILLEKKAAKYILENIRASYGNTAGLVSRVANFEEDTGLELTLANLLDYYHIDARAMYKYSSFSRLCARADVIDDFEESTEEAMTKAFARFATVDSRRWISFLINRLKNLDDVDFDSLSDIERRMMQMFYITVWNKSIDDWNGDEFLDNIYALADSPKMLQELIELLEYNYNKIDFIDETVDLGFDCPLDLHCTYTRDQLLVAMDFMKPSTVREGVKWLPEKNTDVFFVTLNKSDKDYSPTTMYNDYSINEILFHWQSQSTTADTSTTGQRYIHHKERGSKVLLFVREFKNDTFGNTAPYTFLGTANYVKHNGSKPMNVTWKLDKLIPAKYLKRTNKLVVG